MSELQQRAAEIAEFLGIPEADAVAELSKGFGALHAAVNDDFRRANPQTDEQLLEWYRTTERYIWELSAYHLDPGFNYAGMCEGIASRLKAEGAQTVLCLGDGIGDLTLAVHGMNDTSVAVYHDLLESRTSNFAWHRFEKQTGDMLTTCLNKGWEPELNWLGQKFDAIVSLDFLEHCVDVPGYVRAIYDALKPGGLMMAQNAFACGSGPDGSIPMHLVRNDRFEKDWDPLCSSVGFIQESSNWYRRPL